MQAGRALRADQRADLADFALPVVLFTSPRRRGAGENGLDREHGNLLVLEPLHAGHADGADQLTIDDDRKPPCVAMSGNVA